MASTKFLQVHSYYSLVAPKIKLTGTKQAAPASYVLWWAKAYAYIREAAG